MRTLQTLFLGLMLWQPARAEDLVIIYALRQVNNYSYTHPNRSSALWFLAALLFVAGLFWFGDAVKNKGQIDA